jgi:hypothetical protein
MNNLRRPEKLLADSKAPSLESRLSAARTGRNISILLLSLLIAAAMITWFGFLGWGVLAAFRWLLNCIKGLATDF